jgi:glycosyltransferase involved in cell wall biosynthesis
MSGVTIITSFSEDAVGAPMAALRLAYGLRERGHDTSVLFVYERTRIEQPYHPYEVVWRRRPRVYELPTVTKKIADRLSSHRTHAAITFLPLANAVGHCAAAIAGVSARIVSHRVTVNSYRLGWQVLDSLMARAGVYTDIVAVSGAVRDSCIFYPKPLRDRSKIVYNGLLDWTPSTLSREQARSRFGLSAQCSIIVSTGRLHPDKNFGTLIPVLERLPEVTLVIAGEGPERADLENRIRQRGLEGRFRLIGLLPPKEIPDLLAAADAFVQPSTVEGQSNSLLEALYAGLPCIASDLPQMYETLMDANGETAGAILKPSDVKAWVEALQTILHQPERRTSIQAAVQRRAQYFSFQRMIDGFEQVITEHASTRA